MTHTLELVRFTVEPERREEAEAAASFPQIPEARAWVDTIANVEEMSHATVVDRA